jgi:hypothetical protein
VSEFASANKSKGPITENYFSITSTLRHEVLVNNNLMAIPASHLRFARSHFHEEETLSKRDLKLGSFGAEYRAGGLTGNTRRCVCAAILDAVDAHSTVQRKYFASAH